MPVKHHVSKDGKIRPCYAKVCRLGSASPQLRAVVSANQSFLDALKPEARLAFIEDQQRKLSQTTHEKAIAKVKTAYRETGCILGIMSQKGQGIRAITAMSSEEYLSLVQKTHPNLRSGEENALMSMSWERGHMPPEIRETVLNNYRLGDKIRGYYYYHRDTAIEPDTVKWVGDDTTHAPADVVVNGEKWSLKEKSDIIKNQSAASLLNTLTNSENYGRGFHVLNEFAPQENFEGLNEVISHYNKDNPDTAYAPIKDYSEWEAKPKPERKLLSRYIQSKSKSSPEFKATMENLKTRINEKAGEEFVKKIQDTSQVNAGTLIGDEKEYFYAKINNNNKMSVGFIPDKDAVAEHVKVVDVWHQAGPQLNIFIKYENSRGENLVTVNEIRYSHGQFNGTPEAKMKIYEGDFVDFVDNGRYPKKKRTA